MLKRAVVFVLVLGVGVGVYWYARADASARVKQTMLTAADLMELGPDDTVYVRGLIEAAHPAAFGAALNELKNAGGKFNAVTYKNEIVRLCVERARADGKMEFAQTLEHAFGEISFDVDER